eukprot:7333885-Heterocapsa_arctica.AAC.1
MEGNQEDPQEDAGMGDMPSTCWTDRPSFPMKAMMGAILFLTIGYMQMVGYPRAEIEDEQVKAWGKSMQEMTTNIRIGNVHFHDKGI